jgi:hypothetical protein
VLSRCSRPLSKCRGAVDVFQAAVEVLRLLSRCQSRRRGVRLLSRCDAAIKVSLRSVEAAVEVWRPPSKYSGRRRSVEAAVEVFVAATKVSRPLSNC